MEKFTEKQIKKISKLNVECNGSSGGYDKDLHCGFYENQLYADYYYESRDCDGDWGTSCSRISGISFSELLEIIKKPYAKFDTRSWN